MTSPLASKGSASPLASTKKSGTGPDGKTVTSTVPPTAKGKTPTTPTTPTTAPLTAGNKKDTSTPATKVTGPKTTISPTNGKGALTSPATKTPVKTAAPVTTGKKSTPKPINSKGISTPAAPKATAKPPVSSDRSKMQTAGKPAATVKPVTKAPATNVKQQPHAAGYYNKKPAGKRRPDKRSLSPPRPTSR